MIDSITANIENLETQFPGRISFGWIGDYEFNSATGNCDINKPNTKIQGKLPGTSNNAPTFYVHVWGANAGNFNYAVGKQGPFGAGQASCFSHQRPGVFGISTMPPAESDKAKLMAEDKTLSSY